MDDDVRIEPGISLWKLFLIIVMIWYSLTSGSVIFLAVTVYLLFSAVVGEGFWPYLTEEEARELRRKKIMESYDDDSNGDSQEQPPEDTDKH